MSIQKELVIPSQAIVDHARSHIEYSSQLFKTGLFSDCTIVCQNRSWRLHKAFLALRCGFFKACFSNRFQGSCSLDENGNPMVSMHEDDPDALDRTFRWLYTLQFPSQTDSVPLETENDQKDVEQPREVGVDSATLSTKDDGRSMAEAKQTACTPRQLPQRFWTRELSLFIVADKYNLTDLAVQVTASIESAVQCYSNVDSLKSDCDSPLSQFDDFLDMLEMLYTDLPSTLSDVRHLQRTLVCRSAMILAVHTNQQPRISDLMMAVPVLATDLVEALRQIVEVHAGNNKNHLFGHDLIPTAGSVTSSRSPSTGSIYASGSETDSNGRIHVAARPKVYIPMNEDSDTD